MNLTLTAAAAPSRQQFRRFAVRKDHILETPRDVARNFCQPRFREGKRCFIPVVRLKVKWNHTCKIIHDSEDGSIRRGRDGHRRHGCNFGVNQRRGDANASQPLRYELRQPLRQRAHIAGGDQDREKRIGTQENEKRLAIHHQLVDVPVAQRGVRLAVGGCGERQKRLQFSGGAENDREGKINVVGLNYVFESC